MNKWDFSALVQHSKICLVAFRSQCWLLWVPFWLHVVPCWSDFDKLKPTMCPTTPKNISLFICFTFFGSGLSLNTFQQICVSIWASFFNQACITFLLPFFIFKPQPHNTQPHNLRRPSFRGTSVLNRSLISCQFKA